MCEDDLEVWRRENEALTIRNAELEAKVKRLELVVACLSQNLGIARRPGGKT
jgi:cell division septum initiation protein DivIVA